MLDNVGMSVMISVSVIYGVYLFKLLFNKSNLGKILQTA